MATNRQLNELYNQLDSISSQYSSSRSNHSNADLTPNSTLRMGHVAPSHRRFAMPKTLQRKGREPRDGGEGWMWASGQVGSWPDLQEMEHTGIRDEDKSVHGLGEEGCRDDYHTRGLVDALQGIRDNVT